MKSVRPNWRGLAEVLGIVSVVGSLIFVALEIRQNTAAVRSATIQAISEQSYDNGITLAENAELRAAIRAAQTNSLTDDQREQLDYLLGATLRLQQNRYLQSRLGILDEETLLEIGTQEAYRNAYFADYWRRNRAVYSEGFREYIERRIVPLSGESR